MKSPTFTRFSSIYIIKCKLRLKQRLWLLPERIKIIIDNTTTEIVSHFQHLGHNIIYGNANNTDTTTKFYSVYVFIWKLLSSKRIKNTKMTFYKIMVFPTILYVSENWVWTQKDLSRNPEIRKAVQTKDRIQNRVICQKLYTSSLNYKNG